MSNLRVCDACGLPIYEGQAAVTTTLNGEPFDFHDSENCWQRVFAAIISAIAEAKAPPA